MPNILYFPPRRLNRLWGPSSLPTNGYQEIITWSYRYFRLDLTIQIHLILTLKIPEDIPPVPKMSSCTGQNRAQGQILSSILRLYALYVVPSGFATAVPPRRKLYSIFIRLNTIETINVLLKNNK
jgi:hypothetical protein